MGGQRYCRGRVGRIRPKNRERAAATFPRLLTGLIVHSRLNIAGRRRQAAACRTATYSVVKRLASIMDQRVDNERRPDSERRGSPAGRAPPSFDEADDRASWRQRLRRRGGFVLLLVVGGIIVAALLVDRSAPRLPPRLSMYRSPTISSSMPGPNWCVSTTAIMSPSAIRPRRKSNRRRRASTI